MVHESAFLDARRFVDRYLTGRASLQVADVGSFDFNGSLRSLFDRPGWSYLGLDAVAGPNVDHVCSSAYAWPEIPDGAFDVVVSTQTLEHVRHPWRWMPEVARICKPGGLIYICSPNTWGYHAYPIDCWRVWPDGLRALFEEAGVEMVEAYADGPDTTGIGRKFTAAAVMARGQTPPLTVLCLTTGRDTLPRTLGSLRRQTWQPGDRVLLVHDGPAAETVRQLWRDANLPGEMIELTAGPHRDWGHTPRNLILPQIDDGYIVHLDDDDAFAPSALEAIRNAIAEHPTALFLFRIAYSDGRRFWVDQLVQECNVGTGLFVHPAGIPLGRFGSHHNGDWEFVAQTVELNSDRPLVWRREATHLICPHTRWTNPHFQDLRCITGAVGRHDCQAGWHSFFGRWFRGVSILDAGAGLALATPRLMAGGNTVTTQDLAPGLSVDLTCELAEIPDGAFDVVTAFDVVEHVPDDQEFVQQLFRIARTAVVLTTPNVWVWHCENPYHVREYSPPALLDLAAGLTPVDRVDSFVSTHPDGSYPTPLPATAFLGTECPVLGVVIWRTQPCGTRTAELDGKPDLGPAQAHDRLTAVPSLAGDLT